MFKYELNKSSDNVRIFWMYEHKKGSVRFNTITT